MNYTSEKGKNKEICTKEAKKEIYFQINIDKNQNKYYNEGGINIEIFTYKDYLQYKDLFSKKSEDNQKEETNGIEYNKKRNLNKYFNILAKNNHAEGKLQEISMLAEESAKYECVNNEHDKIFRTILGKKQEAVAFINKAIKTNIKIEEIEQYNSSFVNDVFGNEEADIVYKIKERGIFFLIEHQTKIDYSMPYRLLKYQVAIMESAIDENKIRNKSYKIPLVIPIVLYTGDKKWNANKFLEKSQEKIKGVNIRIGNYNLVDVNDFTEKELLEEKDFLSKMMLVEKAKNSDDIVSAVERILKVTKEEDRDLLKRIILIILNRKIGENEAYRLANKLKGDDENMLAVLDMIDRENQMYIDIGRKEGKIEGKKEGKTLEKFNIVKKMLKEKFNIEIIQKITGVDKKEIEKIAKEIEK